jgi:dienelactone hydrolase
MISWTAKWPALEPDASATLKSGRMLGLSSPAVGFHTSLAVKAAKLAPGAIKARMLVCIGADDPFIPPNHREDFESEMRDAGAEWEMQVYGRTVHSFTNPEAGKRNMPEAIRYSAEGAARAWASALDLLARTIG